MEEAYYVYLQTGHERVMGELKMTRTMEWMVVHFPQGGNLGGGMDTWSVRRKAIRDDKRD